MIYCQSNYSRVPALKRKTERKKERKIERQNCFADLVTETISVIDLAVVCEVWLDVGIWASSCYLTCKEFCACSELKSGALQLVYCEG